MASRRLSLTSRARDRTSCHSPPTVLMSAFAVYSLSRPLGGGFSVHVREFQTAQGAISYRHDGTLGSRPSPSSTDWGKLSTHSPELGPSSPRHGSSASAMARIASGRAGRGAFHRADDDRPRREQCHETCSRALLRGPPATSSSRTETLPPRKRVVSPAQAGDFVWRSPSSKGSRSPRGRPSRLQPISCSGGGWMVARRRGQWLACAARGRACRAVAETPHADGVACLFVSQASARQIWAMLIRKLPRALAILSASQTMRHPLSSCAADGRVFELWEAQTGGEVDTARLGHWSISATNRFCSHGPGSG